MSDAIARCTVNVGHHEGSNVLYRHSRTTETILAKPGECLPHRKGDGVWCALVTDNAREKKCLIVVGSGLMWITEGVPLAVGDEINMWCNIDPSLMRSGMHVQGLYRVTAATRTRVHRQDALHIDVVCLGPMDPTKLIHLAGLFNC